MNSTTSASVAAINVTEPPLIVEMREAMLMGTMGVVPMERVNALPDPLPVPVTSGTRGPWTIRTAILTPEKAYIDNLKMLRNCRGFGHLVKPGVYTVLAHKDRGCVMSNTPMEVITNQPIIQAAHGRVLVSGLGLGMALKAILDKPEVKHVTVLELDTDVLALIGPYFNQTYGERVTIRWADTFDYQLTSWERRQHFDIAWHDIWDDISDLRIPEMEKLREHYADYCDTQLFWTEPECHAMKAAMDFIETQKGA